MKVFLAGLGVGAAAGLLFAPHAGSKTRATLAGRAGNLLQSFRRQEPEVGEPVPENEAITELLNTAGKHTLMKVPGIGKGTAKKIIEHRPYESKEDLLQEGVLPEELLDRVKEQLLDKTGNVA